MVGKHFYLALRIADPERGERIRHILHTLFPNKSNVAIGQELGYDESSIRVWTKTGIISTGFLKHLVRYGISEKYILTGEDAMTEAVSENPKCKEDTPMERNVLLLSLALQESVARISRYFAGDETVSISSQDVHRLEETASQLSQHLRAAVIPDSAESTA